MSPWSTLLALVSGVSPPPSTPGGAMDFSGQPSLLAGLVLVVPDVAEPIERLLGIDF